MNEYTYKLLFICRILKLIPKKLTKWKTIIDGNIMEVKSEYLLGVKKAVIDFVLGGSLEKTYKIVENLTTAREELKDARTLFKHR